MTHTDVLKDQVFHKWRGYEPDEIIYTAYIDDHPELIATGHKIQDLYWAFCGARATFLQSFNYTTSNKPDEQFYLINTLNSAILQYGLCYDLLWQIAWAYITPSSFESICKKEPDTLESDCTRETLLSRLNCNIAQNPAMGTIDRKILHWFETTDNNALITELRKLYNYIKHRGTLAYTGICGIPKPLIRIKDTKNPTCTQEIQFLSRREITVSDLDETISDYHFELEKVANELLSLIIPADYKTKIVDFNRALATILNVSSSQEMNT